MKNEIQTYSFDEHGLKQVKQTQKGKNWPVVYLIHNDDQLYIGETTSITTILNMPDKNGTASEKSRKTMSDSDGNCFRWRI